MDSAKGTPQEIKDYVFKCGKWLDDTKNEGNDESSHEEWGELPAEHQGKRNDLGLLKEMIKSGMTDFEILEASPEFLFRIMQIQQARKIFVEAEFKGKLRLDIEVTYIFGETGLGKTRYVHKKYGNSLYSISDYIHPFDEYQNEDVIIFEEFRSDLMIGDMLKYLDIYSLSLPARYANKCACYSKVFIISNVPLEDQYFKVQESNPATWRAFLRRIHKVMEFTDFNIIEYDSVGEYLKRYEPMHQQRLNEFVEVGDLGIFKNDNTNI